MNDLRTIKIEKIADDKTFEYLCRDIWKNDVQNDQVQINGRPGQRQGGVDVFGRNRKNQTWFGIQCKARKYNDLTKAILKIEIDKALQFNPALRKYIICTTLDRDVHLQQVQREFNDELNCKLEIEICFWDDIEELLKEEQNINVYYKYYNKYFTDNTTIGHAIGKLINLELGIGSKTDTHYELMIGKIPKYKESKTNKVNYFRGAYLIINFHERKMETFKIPCFPSDLEAAFANKFDRKRISIWLNSINNLDDFIYNDEESFESYISVDDYKNTLEANDDY